MDRRQEKETVKSGVNLLLILRLNLAFLVTLAAASFLLPLSESERWVVVPAVAVLAGFNWAAIDHLGRG